MSYLHGSWDAFAVTENLVQIFCTQNISQGGLRQQPGGVVSILYVSHWHCCIGHSVINNCIDGNRHWIFGQNLMGTEKKISIRMFMLIGLIFLLVSKTSKRWRKSYVTYVFTMSRKIMPILTMNWYSKSKRDMRFSYFLLNYSIIPFGRQFWIFDGSKTTTTLLDVLPQKRRTTFWVIPFESK